MKAPLSSKALLWTFFTADILAQVSFITPKTAVFADGVQVLILCVLVHWNVLLRHLMELS